MAFHQAFGNLAERLGIFANGADDTDLLAGRACVARGLRRRPAGLSRRGRGSGRVLRAYDLVGFTGNAELRKIVGSDRRDCAGAQELGGTSVKR